MVLCVCQISNGILNRFFGGFKSRWLFECHESHCQILCQVRSGCFTVFVITRFSQFFFSSFDMLES